jgi:hypothetical protein
MRIFGKATTSGPDAVFPLSEPQPKQAVDLPVDRFIEEIHYALGQISVLIQDYTRKTNILNEMSLRRRPPSRELQEEANLGFEWMTERIRNWTETFEWQFRSFSPPTDDLKHLQEPLTRWMVGWRDGAYYAYAAKMYYARADNSKGKYFEQRSGECTKFQSESICEFFQELEFLLGEDPDLFDLLKIPEWLVGGMVIELSNTTDPRDIFRSLPALLTCYPHVESLLEGITR